VQRTWTASATALAIVKASRTDSATAKASRTGSATAKASLSAEWSASPMGLETAKGSSRAYRTA
jgi:hypothetical protein